MAQKVASNLCFDVAVKLVEEAGCIVKKNLWSQKTVSKKSSPMDLVTNTDKEVENILISGLRTEFPNHKFIGEESTTTAVLTDDPTWIIDPVDGTLNFYHGNPCVSISVGLYVNKEPEIGIIHVPVFSQMFTAIKGEGSKLNGKPIKVSEQKCLKESLVALEGGTSDEADRRQCVIHNFQTLYPLVQGFRSYGSAAYNMVNVAMGAIDCYFEYGIHIWDMAAGNLIVKEAGGTVIDPAGGPLDLMNRRMLCASSTELANECIQHLKQNYPKRDDE